MLLIRKEQYEVFEKNMRRRFLEKLCAHVRSTFPERSEELTDIELEEQIIRELSVGSEYGLKSERDLILFVDLTWILGRDYIKSKDYKWVNDILVNESWEPDVRMAFIYRRLGEEETEKENQST